MKRLIFDALVDEENICNQKKVIDKMKRLILDGRKIVLYGKRNRAKTSIVKNVIIPYWYAKKRNGLAIYIELMHVKSLDDINDRFTKSFNSELQKKAKAKAFMQTAFEALRGVSPTYTLGDDGKMEFGLSLRGKKIIEIETLLDKVSDLHNSGKPCLLCFDEFQDICKISGAEALLRRKFEELPLDMPIICLGSKRHLLFEVFHKKEAPFAEWGTSIELEEIPYGEYASYIRDRLTDHLKNCPESVLVYLQDRLLRSPEAVHRIAFEANSRFPNENLTEELVDQLISEYVTAKSSFYETKMEYLSVGQIKFLKLIANAAIPQIDAIYSKDRLASLDMTAGGLRKALQKLMDNGDVECLGGTSYAMTDPFLMHYIRLTRVS